MPTSTSPSRSRPRRGRRSTRRPAGALTAANTALRSGSGMPRDIVESLGDVAESMVNDLLDCPEAALALDDLNAFDDYTHKHSVQVTLLGLLIARRAWQTDGWIDYRGRRRFDRIDDRMRKLGLGLLVHDVGKLAVPPEILNKPGRLTGPEMEIMKTHAVAGVELLRPADSHPCRLSIVRDHHERVDGSGYPEGLFGAQVQEFPRIAAVADVYDAVTSERVYKPAAPPHVGVKVIRAGSGSQFCPNVVRHFRAVVMPYPVGHEMRLPDGRVGVVSSVQIDDPGLPDRARLGPAGVEELVVDMTAEPAAAARTAAARRPRRQPAPPPWRVPGHAAPSSPGTAPAPPRRVGASSQASPSSPGASPCAAPSPVVPAGLDAAVVEADRQRRLLAGGGGARDRLAGLVLQQGVTAFQRALGVVGRERAEDAVQVASAALSEAADVRSSVAASVRALREARSTAKAAAVALRAARRRAAARAFAGRRSHGGSRRAARGAAGAGACGGGRRGGRARGRGVRACGRVRAPRGGPGGAGARRSARARRGPPCSRPGRRSRRRGSGVEHATAATSSSSVRSVWWPTLEITGTRSSATVRHRVSSQNANRSASEPPPRATTITSTSSHAARSCSLRVIAGAACRSCTGAKPHTTRPAQPRRRSPASTSSRALPDSPVTTPMQLGRRGRGSAFCGANSPSACSRLRSWSSWASRSPSPATRSRVTANENDGDAVREPGVVVAPARHDDLRAVRERADVELVEVLAPHRARQRAGGVAQLEPDLRAARLEPEHLAEDLHAREAAQAVLERGRVLADGERAREGGAGDAVGHAIALTLVGAGGRCGRCVVRGREEQAGPVRTGGMQSRRVSGRARARAVRQALMQAAHLRQPADGGRAVDGAPRRRGASRRPARASGSSASDVARGARAACGGPHGRASSSTAHREQHVRAASRGHPTRAPDEQLVQPWWLPAGSGAARAR